MARSGTIIRSRCVSADRREEDLLGKASAIEEGTYPYTQTASEDLARSAPWSEAKYLHSEADDGKVEARGVEPLSWRLFAQASTCIAASWCLREPASVRQSGSPIILFSLTARPGYPASLPACWWSRTAVAGVRQSTSLSIKQRVQARWSLQLFFLIGFLGGQPINLHMQPAFPTFSRNRGAPVFEVWRNYIAKRPYIKREERVSPGVSLPAGNRPSGLWRAVRFS